MGKLKVQLKNETSIPMKIQEVHAGVIATMRVLKSQEKYTLAINGDATYREYVISLPNNKPINQTISSDDVAEYREILIKERESTKKDASGKELSGKEYYWVGISRGEKSEDANSLEQHPIVAPASPAAGQAVVAAASPAADRVVVCSKSMSFFQKLKKKFS